MVISGINDKFHDDSVLWRFMGVGNASSQKKNLKSYDDDHLNLPANAPRHYSALDKRNPLAYGLGGI